MSLSHTPPSQSYRAEQEPTSGTASFGRYATTSDHVHGSAFIKHLLSCSYEIKILRLWAHVLKRTVLFSSILSRHLSVELRYYNSEFN
jgi:hypothetical protein